MKNVNNFNIEKTKVKRQIVFCWNDGYDYSSHTFVDSMESARLCVIEFMRSHDWIFNDDDIEKIRTLEPLQDNVESCRLINLIIHSIIGGSSEITMYVKIENVYKYEVEND